MAARTPPAKAAAKRGVRRAALEKGVDNLITNSVEADKKYIMKQLDENGKIVGTVASMIRDGEIEKAFQRRQLAALTQTLGAKIPNRIRKFRSFTPHLWYVTLEMMLGVDDLDDMTPPGGEALKDKEIASLCKYALGVADDTDVPSDYDSTGFEGPLLCVLKARYEQQGSRLQGATYQTLKAGIGFFIFDPATPTMIKVRGRDDLVFDIGYTEEMLEGKPLYVKDNHSLTGATLVDDDSGFSQNLYKRLTTAHRGHGLEQDTTAFEFPDAAAKYKGLAAPTEPSVASSAAAAELEPPSTPAASTPAVRSPLPTGPPLLPAGRRPPTKRIRVKS